MTFQFQSIFGLFYDLFKKDSLLLANQCHKHKFEGLDVKMCACNQYRCNVDEDCQGACGYLKSVAKNSPGAFEFYSNYGEFGDYQDNEQERTGAHFQMINEILSK